MFSIKIIKDNYITHFDHQFVSDYENNVCQMCEYHSISLFYVVMINRLKDFNFLDKNYLPRCCFCDFLLNFDDLEIYNDSIFYLEKFDDMVDYILSSNFYIGQISKNPILLEKYEKLKVIKND